METETAPAAPDLDTELGTDDDNGQGTEPVPPPEAPPIPEVNATPAARRLAAENSIDLDYIDGSGADDRVTVDDVEAAIAKREAAGALPPGQVDHKRGCPEGAERPDGKSVEIYEARQPIRAEDGTLIRYATVKVAHCVDCGETAVTAAD